MLWKDDWKISNISAYQIMYKCLNFLKIKTRFKILCIVERRGDV